jgi:hypothetical protein
MKSQMKSPWWWRVSIWCTANNKLRVIADREGKDVYLLRYYLHPRWMTLGMFRVVLHRFMRSDAVEDGLHDHPWPYITIILQGGYIEHTPKGAFLRKKGQVLFRRAKSLHRVELLNDGVPVYTLFIMGPRWRSWGFKIGDQWYPWREWIEKRKAGI